MRAAETNARRLPRTGNDTERLGQVAGASGNSSGPFSVTGFPNFIVRSDERILLRSKQDQSFFEELLRSLIARASKVSMVSPI